MANEPSADDLIVESVSHRYGEVEAVKEASLSIAAGEIHSLLGESGSGKSTLLRIIAGLEKPCQGVVRIGDEILFDDAHFVSPESRSVGLVFQDYALFPHLSVIENVIFGMSGGTKSQRRKRAMELLESVDLASSAKAYPHTLSGGQQQRVALVRSLAREPAVMLLDEPFSGLDPALRSDVRDMTAGLLRESQVATLLVTHDPLEAVAVSDRISVIHEGRMIQTDSSTNLLEYPADEATSKLFSSIQLLDGGTSRSQTFAQIIRVPMDDQHDDPN
ncbi:MAG: ABC transporter ATP-binding protein [Planctomycetota bacterium]